MRKINLRQSNSAFNRADRRQSHLSQPGFSSAFRLSHARTTQKLADDLSRPLCQFESANDSRANHRRTDQNFWFGEWRFRQKSAGTDGNRRIEPPFYQTLSARILRRAASTDWY